MAIAELYSMSAVTVSTTPVSIITGSTSTATDTTDGVFQAQVYTGNMAKGDEYEVTLWEKAVAGGTQREVMAWPLMGAQARDLLIFLPILMHGWDLRIAKLAGTDRAFSASIRQVA